jgi:sporulation protein YlmC with PRC-barrel domain
MRIPTRAWTAALIVILLVALALTLLLQLRPQAANLPTPPAQATAAAYQAPPSQTPVLFVPAAVSPSASGTPAAPAKLLAASTVADFTVTNQQGMLLGQLENVAVDFASGQVLYAFLRFGRDPATADQFFAVPFAVLELNRQGQGFVLHSDSTDFQSQSPLNRQVLAAGPVLPGDFHPLFGPRSTGTVEPVTPAPGVTPIPTVASPKGALVLLPGLIGWHLARPDGQQLGVVQDLPIDAHSARVRWAVVVLGNALATDKKLVPVPLAALRLDAADAQVNMNITQAQLAAAPGFAQDKWPDTAQAGWDSAFAQYWQKQGVPTGD